MPELIPGLAPELREIPKDGKMFIWYFGSWDLLVIGLTTAMNY